MSDELVVLAEDVSKTYQPSPGWLRLLARSSLREPVVALDGVSLRLAPGEICVVVGPNGAGKTTLFRLLAGLTTADRGTLRVGGLDPESDGRSVRGMIGWMPTERRSLFLRQTTRENLRFHARLHQLPGADIDRRIDEVLESVGLPGKGDVTPQAFSDGMRARLLLARALLPQPRLLILDEPTGPIDPVAAFGLLELIRGLVSQLDVAALISSHRLEEISALRGRVHLLDRGRTVFDGDLGNLQSRGVQTVVTWATTEAAEAGARRLQGSLANIAVDVEDREVRFVRPPDLPVGTALAGLGTLDSLVISIDERPVPLRDVLADFYRGDRV